MSGPIKSNGLLQPGSNGCREIWSNDHTLEADTGNIFVKVTFSFSLKRQSRESNEAICLF